MNRPEAVKQLVNLPVDVRQFLEREAARNLSTMNSEVVRSIRARMEAEQREKAEQAVR